MDKGSSRVPWLPISGAGRKGVVPTGVASSTAKTRDGDGPPAQPRTSRVPPAGGRKDSKTVRAAKPPGARTRKNGRNSSPATIELSPNARVVLERRYLSRDEAGNVVETPEQLFRRVAHNVALAEKRYLPAGRRADQAARAWEERFYGLMASLRFLPNSPTLGNAGRPLQQLSACFVLPVDDDMESIFEAIKDTALIHKSGGGTGFSFSRLRPAGDLVQATGGIASGPVSFMKVFDAATEAIKQGGTRRGANMAILSVDHPDIDEFVAAKSDMVTLQNFNISVAVADRFMDAVDQDAEYDLVNPRTGEVTGKRRAREIFRRIAENAWKNGDPGLVFLDRINRDNPTPQLGKIEATNPCGEQPLLPYESCNLGSINLAKFVTQRPARRGRSKDGSAPTDIDWARLGEVIPLCVRFLDDIIDQNVYPIPSIEEMTKKTRKVGLGVMGWADLLLRLGIPYGSDEAVALAGRVMAFIEEKANDASEDLARERGVFPAWTGSAFDPDSPNRRPEWAGRRYRNSTRTTIAPTGTLSIIADCSGGIEPLFALAFFRQHHLDREHPERVTRLATVNPEFERVAKERGFYSDDLVAHLAGGGRLSERTDVPDDVKRVFVTSHDVDATWHVRMQAAFQRHTDNAVSKTINLPRKATVEDVERAYLLAYRDGCKGITIYRDESRPLQVLTHATARGPEQAEAVEAERALGIGAAPPPVESLAPRPPGAPYRRHLPDERRSITHKFRVGEQEGYVTVGLYDDGSPGEVFITISKEGSTIRGLMDSVAVLTSVALQYGVPLEDLVRKFRGVHFEPAGLTSNPAVPTASSIVDYVFRWLERRFLAEARERTPAGSVATSAQTPAPARKKRASGSKRSRSATREAAPVDLANAVPTGLACPDCGGLLVYQEGCLICPACAYTKCG